MISLGQLDHSLVWSQINRVHILSDKSELDGILQELASFVRVLPHHDRIRKARFDPFVIPGVLSCTASDALLLDRHRDHLRSRVILWKEDSSHMLLISLWRRSRRQWQDGTEDLMKCPSHLFGISRCNRRRPCTFDNSWRSSFGKRGTFAAGLASCWHSS